MASISTRSVAGQPRYDVNYREPDGRKRRKTFTKKGDATRFAATVEADKLRGTYLDPDAGRMTFKAYAEEWRKSQPHESTTSARIEERLRLHVYPELGSKSLAQIKPSTIRAWLAGVPGAESSRRVILGNVSAILSAAVDDERIAKNPCKAASVKRPTVIRDELVPWTSERVGAVYGGMHDRFKITVTLAAGLGLRQGEVFGLSVDDVDFLRGTVAVRRQVRLLNGRLYFAPPKFGKSRTVPLPAHVRDELAAYLAKHPARAVTLPWKVDEGQPTTVTLAVTTRQGTALNRTWFNSSYWRPALKKGGIEIAPGTSSQRSGDGMHALRHYYASKLLDGGVSIKAVANYLGHHDPAFTLRTYIHLMPGSAEKAAEVMDAALAGYMCATSEAPTGTF